MEKPGSIHLSKDLVKGLGWSKHFEAAQPARSRAEHTLSSGMLSILHHPFSCCSEDDGWSPYKHWVTAPGGFLSFLLQCFPWSFWCEQWTSHYCGNLTTEGLIWTVLHVLFSKQTFALFSKHTSFKIQILLRVKGGLQRMLSIANQKEIHQPKMSWMSDVSHKCFIDHLPNQKVMLLLIKSNRFIFTEQNMWGRGTLVVPGKERTPVRVEEVDQAHPFWEEHSRDRCVPHSRNRCLSRVFTWVIRNKRRNLNKQKQTHKQTHVN